MAVTTLAGHPLHPQLVQFPMGLLPFSFALDLMHLCTGKQSYADAAYYTMVGGCAGAAVAGASGAADYFEIPEKTESKKVANLHAVLNISIMGLYGLNLMLRQGRQKPGVLPVLLSALGTAGLIFSGWYGGELVYKLGMRVKPVMDEDGPKHDEWKLPGDEKMEKAMTTIQRRFAPASK